MSELEQDRSLEDVESTKFYVTEVQDIFTGSDLDRILRHCHEKGSFSDIYFSDGDDIILKSHGRVYSVLGGRCLRMDELTRFFERITDDPAGTATVLQGIPFDGAYTHSSIDGDNRSRLNRYRVNAIIALNPKGLKGMQVTMRTINFVPPQIASMKLECGILKNYKPRQGLVIIAGETGSGKTTFLASILRDRMEEKGGNCIINAYEAPIEYLHSELSYKSDPSNKVYQTEVNPLGWIDSFATGIRASLRRNPNGFLIGECRDLETIEASIRAASSGHFVYTTTHANSVSDTIMRMINEFPNNEKQARYYELISNSRLLIAQYLAPSTDGQRVPVREYLSFTPEIRDQLKRVDLKDAERVIREIIDGQGEYDSPLAQSMTHSAKYHLEAGNISKDVFEHIISGV
ncbi:Twitching mobility protein [compost metagenome]